MNRIGLFIAFLLLADLLGAQAVFSEPVNAQEYQDKHRVSGEPSSPANAAGIARRTEELRNDVNGKATVRTRCTSDRRTVDVEETTEIAEIRGCKLVFRTRKLSGTGAELREIEFTLRVNLSELTTPSSIAPQTFRQCQAIDGPVVRVMSRTKPGSPIQVIRRSVSKEADAKVETQSARSDLSLFFPKKELAARAGRSLDRAIEHCGGQEWPDEDDLP